MAVPLEATSVLSDVVEWSSEEIIFAQDPSDLMKKWETLEFFWNQLPNKRNYGRLFARYKLAKIVVAVAHSDAYSQEEVSGESKGKKKSLVHPPLSLVQWSNQHWNDLQRLLQSTRDVLLRKDADSLLLNDEEEHEERAESDLYNIKLDRIVPYIRINKALADFRVSLEQDVFNKNATTIKVEPSVLAKFRDSIQEDFGDSADEKIRGALERLLVVSGGGGKSTRSHGVSLVSPDELRSILRASPFNLLHVQRKILSLVRRWTRDVFETKPTLTRLGYNPDALVVSAMTQKREEASDEDEEEDSKLPAIPGEDDENTSPSPKKTSSERRPKRKRDAAVDSNVEKLKSARRELSQEGTDPMQEIQRIAATATTTTRTTRSGLLEKKKSATRVQFGDSDSEEDDENERAHLSEVPTRAKLASPKRKSLSSKQQTKGGIKRRVPFSQEEKTAIRRGVEQHGVGKWSEIKSEYAVILKNRTAVNIKDCYRTMHRKGEI